MPPGAFHCHDWDYEAHPDAAIEVPARCARILQELTTGLMAPGAHVSDTRPIHKRVFRGLTPPTCGYLAGNYRGSSYHSLRNYDVRIGLSAGMLAPNVAAAMDSLRRSIGATIQLLDAKVPTLSPPEVLVILATVCAELNAAFLAIHPYANGNGHMGRFIVWSLLGRYGYWPRAWPLHQRPNPPYDALLNGFLAGDKQPFIQYVLTAIVGPPVPPPPAPAAPVSP